MGIRKSGVLPPLRTVPGSRLRDFLETPEKTPSSTAGPDYHVCVGASLPPRICREVLEYSEQFEHPGSLTDPPLSLGPVIGKDHRPPFF